MTDKEKVYFNRESQQKIGKVTYIITSHFCESGEDIISKIRKLLLDEVASLHDKNVL